MASLRTRTLAIALLVLGAVVMGACGGAEATSATDEEKGSTATTAAPVAVATPTPTPLVAPKGCRPEGTALEIAAQSASWMDAKGRTLGEGEACLAAPADKPFTVKMLNDPNNEGFAPFPHNLSIYDGSPAGEKLYQSGMVPAGKTKTLKVPAMAEGVYFFTCDVHPQSMAGVLVID